MFIDEAERELVVRPKVSYQIMLGASSAAQLLHGVPRLRRPRLIRWYELLGHDLIRFHHGPKLGTGLLVTCVGQGGKGAHAMVGVGEEAFKYFALPPSNATIPIQRALCWRYSSSVWSSFAQSRHSNPHRSARW